MAKVFKIIVENNLIIEKREINIYHHSRTRTFIISGGNTVSIPLKSKEELDYMHISIVKGPGNLQNECFLDLPAWIDFELFANNLNGTIHFIHAENRTYLQIPPGPPNWELKITLPDTKKMQLPVDGYRIIFHSSLPIVNSYH